MSDIKGHVKDLETPHEGPIFGMELQWGDIDCLHDIFLEGGERESHPQIS